MAGPGRWTLPDLESALGWARERKGQGIRCTLATLGEYARSPAEARAETEENIACLRGIVSLSTDASLSVKLSGIGGLFDGDAARANLVQLAREARTGNVPIELDMEGKGMVDLTLRAASECRKEIPHITVALQSYLNRTGDDIRRMVSEGVNVRLVKGAYVGDTSDASEIRRMTEADARLLKSLRVPFSLGTHDPGLIAWAEGEFGGARDSLEFGFLRGLSEETKVRLAHEGWKVSEYVPFGPGGDAYVMRRERYLRELAGSGRAPAP
ncbi:MAG TPA: proline dehydrogenase family protein [Methanomicrobiales archaeon]|nr:proline dehydrogenase family protein [Methanomicrobiales archaeon]